MHDYFVGQLAKRVGINTEAIRYYERIHLLPRPVRKESGYRIYGETDLKRLLFIKRAKELGFTLKEVKELLELKVDSDAHCGDVKQLAERKLAAIEQKLKDLKRIKMVLEKLIHQCVHEEISSDACPILESIELEAE